MQRNPGRQAAAAHIEPGAHPVLDPPARRRGGLFALLHAGKERVQRLSRRHASATDGVEQLVLGGDAEAIERRAEGDGAAGLAGAFEGLVDGGATETDELLLLGLADVAADGRTGAAGDGQRAPFRMRGRRRAADHLDHVAIGQRVAQRAKLTVDLDADGGVADVGMDRIGEVERHGAARQADQPALGREDEHLVDEHFQLGVLDQVLGVAAVFEHLDQVAQIDQRIATAGGFHGLGVEAVGGVLVAPVGGDAVLGDPIHRLGADLHLDAHAARTHHRGVDRAVVVALGRRYEVLEPLWNTRPGTVDDAQRAVAVLLGVEDDSEGIDVGQLIEADRLALQLAPDRIGMLFAAIDPRRQALRLQFCGDLATDDRHRLALAAAQGLQPPHNGPAGDRIEMLEG